MPPNQMRQREPSVDFAFGVDGVAVVDDRVDADAEEHQPAEERREPDEQELAHAREQLVPVVPRAGEAGEAVVEADREAERDDGEFEHAFRRSGSAARRPRSRAAPKPQRRHGRREEALVDACRTPRGSRFQCAIDSVVRAVGRIVVCVEAEAEVSTAMIRNLTPTAPSTRLPSALSTSPAFSSLARKPVPW